MKSLKWKFLFFGLLAVNLFAIFTVVFLAALPVEDEKIRRSVSREEDIQFEINTNKNDLNKLINQYLAKEGMTGPIHYEVYLTNDVELFGTLPIFGKEMELKMTFEPKALENGDLVLRQKSISLGQMNLPVSYVLNFVNERYKTPDWVSIQPNDESIYVSLQNMKLKSDVRVKTERFDLKNDNITFLLTVPSQ
ncbi:DUF2140 family protein [Peribacillus cavernae]|uniref:DUF2140 family protein n=1 Tax=Peribacillus cavernae TaxID=1674310 RepID=A0A433HWB0_9BACI|nr:YpmS family protein [Peribacillus cavernae]MDQ0217964.1 uncharacterized protein YpmS [Peribacillus cavernae]RUQ32609.1 DUF2140 family protein [Peribacillus cavernae]